MVEPAYMSASERCEHFLQQFTNGLSSLYLPDYVDLSHNKQNLSVRAAAAFGPPFHPLFSNPPRENDHLGVTPDQLERLAQAFIADSILGFKGEINLSGNAFKDGDIAPLLIAVKKTQKVTGEALPQQRKQHHQQQQQRH